jgi:hypothetical protein
MRRCGRRSGPWFGVGSSAVWRWRKAFGVTEQFGTPGSKAAHLAASKKGGAGLKAKVWTDAELDVKAARMRDQWRAGHRTVPDRWKETGWTRKQLALLGTAPDKVIARRIGRSRSAVRSKRWACGIPKYGAEPMARGRHLSPPPSAPWSDREPGRSNNRQRRSGRRSMSRPHPGGAKRTTGSSGDCSFAPDNETNPPC